MLTPAQKEQILTVLKDTEATIQQSIDAQYQIQDENGAALFFKERLPVICQARDNMETLLLELMK